jgi:hypothetical protein
MTPEHQQIIQRVNSHNVFVGATTEMLHWFQTAVAGYRAELVFDTEFEKINATIAADSYMPPSIQNHWEAFAKVVQAAYGNFGRDVVTRHGVDEPAQVRNLALNTVGSAYQQARIRAREFLIAQLEVRITEPAQK